LQTSPNIPKGSGPEQPELLVEASKIKEQITYSNMFKGIARVANTDPQHIRRLYKDLMELTKFKLSMLNSVGAFSMFYFYAPMSGIGAFNSLIFLFATQTVAMSSQCFG